MAKDKLRKFSEITEFSNVLQMDEGKPMLGQWGALFFKNNYPLILELACGKGEYSVSLARMFAETNFLGVDYKGNRIWRGAKTAIDEGIGNAGFLRIQIENIAEYFSEGEVDEIWITFPDPQPQVSREKKRLTSPRFLQMYKRILKPGGFIHLKTDSDALYAYTLQVIAGQGLKIHVETTDLYHSPYVNEVLSIKTYYEGKYLSVNKNINYVKYSFE